MTPDRHDFYAAASEFVFVRDEPEPSQVIFVPGSSFRGHVLAAAELYARGLAPLVAPSGLYAKGRERFGDGTFPSEWACMRETLVSLGVPDRAIVREDRATYTWENARFTREALDAMGVSVRGAILCCRPFHARRALLYYQAAFPEARISVCPAREEGLNRDDWFLTAEGRDRVFGEIEKLGAQVRPQAEMLLKEGRR